MTGSAPATAVDDGTAGPAGRPSPPPVSRRTPRPPVPWRWLLGAVLVVAVGARTWSPSALWLDEALSIGIARLPVPDLLDALRRDGSPPLYYLLLHVWTGVFGTGDLAVRLLSSVFSIATLPLVWLAGRRLAGPGAAWAAVLVLGVSPFAVRYATETRMYALVQLLSAAGLLLLLRALDRPTLGRLLPLSLVSGALALTHYWALFLLAVTGALLLHQSLRGRDRRAARRCLAGLAGGGVLFLPWLPDFLFQVQRTGTPWAAAPRASAPYDTVNSWAGGPSGAGVVLTLLLVGLGVLALVGRPHREGRGVVLSRPADPVALALLLCSFGALVLGLVVGLVVGAGYAFRYSSSVLVPAVLLAALGVRALPPRGRLGALALVAVTGLAGVAPQPFSERRTQAAETAQAMELGLAPGDTVIYCPDQLGPDVSRLLPASTDQVVYPTLARPTLVDWVDYAQRNAAADPTAVAGRLDARSAGALWLVSAGGYRTFGMQCEQLADALTARRGGEVLWVARSPRFDQQQQVTRYPPRPLGVPVD